MSISVVDCTLDETRKFLYSPLIEVGEQSPTEIKASTSIGAF